MLNAAKLFLALFTLIVTSASEKEVDYDFSENELWKYYSNKISELEKQYQNLKNKNEKPKSFFSCFKKNSNKKKLNLQKIMTKLETQKIETKLEMHRQKLNELELQLQSQKNLIGEKDVCIICLDGFENNSYTKSNCGHIKFHSECIEERKKKSKECPDGRTEWKEKPKKEKSPTKIQQKAQNYGREVPRISYFDLFRQGKLAQRGNTCFACRAELPFDERTLGCLEICERCMIEESLKMNPQNRPVQPLQNIKRPIDMCDKKYSVYFNTSIPQRRESPPQNDNILHEPIDMRRGMEKRKICCVCKKKDAINGCKACENCMMD